MVKTTASMKIWATGFYLLLSTGLTSESLIVCLTVIPDLQAVETVIQGDELRNQSRLMAELFG